KCSQPLRNSPQNGEPSAPIAYQKTNRTAFELSVRFGQANALISSSVTRGEKIGVLDRDDHLASKAVSELEQSNLSLSIELLSILSTKLNSSSSSRTPHLLALSLSRVI